jgi:hypothetical protein
MDTTGVISGETLPLGAWARAGNTPNANKIPDIPNPFNSIVSHPPLPELHSAIPELRHSIRTRSEVKGFMNC